MFYGICDYMELVSKVEDCEYKTKLTKNALIKLKNRE